MTDSFPVTNVKEQPRRLYGRRQSHPLRARQAYLLENVLPRFLLSDPGNPDASFPEDLRGMPLYLEIGFGGGEHAIAQAKSTPCRYVAAEVFENGLCSILNQLVAVGAEDAATPPANLRLWNQDARQLLAALPDQSLERVYLMFPDPWPKGRHAKRRFVHPANIAELARTLRPGGIWRIATDHPVYQDWVREIMANQPYFEHSEPKTALPKGWSRTRYEAKAIREERQPLYWSFRRNTLPVRQEENA